MSEVNEGRTMYRIRCVSCAWLGVNLDTQGRYVFECPVCHAPTEPAFDEE